MKKDNKILNFFTSTLGGMANGLFATLIIGTIFATIGSFFTIFKNNVFCDFMIDILGSTNAKKGLSYILQMLTGAGIGIGIALAMKFDSLKTIVMAVVGQCASYFSIGIDNNTYLPIYKNAFQVGDPLTIYLVCIITGLILLNFLNKKTSIDILIIPLIGCFIGLGLSLIIRFPSSYITFAIQWLVSKGTTTVPLIMGIVVSVLMGMALTAPISSAAIASIVFSGNLPGLALAGGAAVIGCSTQMVGFAVQSKRDNNIGQVLSIGIGTSMLQFKNILKQPVIWLPTIITSAILGPISTCVLKIECLGASAGMGTAGFVGQIGTFTQMGNVWQAYIGVFVLQIILPGVIVFFIDLLLRKLKFIREGDFSLKETTITDK